MSSNLEYASPFKTILQELLRDLPLARGAALCDADGESVDSVGVLDSYLLQLAAAHGQILHREVGAAAARWGQVATVRVRTQTSGYLVHALPDGYVLVVLVHPRATFAVPDITLSVAAAELEDEAGWTPASSRQWRRARIDELGGPLLLWRRRGRAYRRA